MPPVKVNEAFLCQSVASFALLQVQLFGGGWAILLVGGHGRHRLRLHPLVALVAARVALVARWVVPPGGGGIGGIGGGGVVTRLLSLMILTQVALR